MRKWTAIFLAMSFLTVSCNKTIDSPFDGVTAPTDSGSTSDGTTTPTATPSIGSEVPVTDSTLPNEALTFETNVTLMNFNDAQTIKYHKAMEIVKLVVATEEFRDQVLNFTYNGLKQFADNKGRTNEQIYTSILEAAETLRPAKNNQMDLEVELYYSNNSVVGYTNGGTTQIWVNTKFFDQFQPNSVAGNLFHEWLHKLGYTHDYASTAKRPYSVPYGIGRIMGNIGKKFL